MRLAIAFVVIFASFQSLNCLTGMLNSRLNFFDIDLLHYTAENAKGNVMVSPASIRSILAMLLEGARGSTADEIRTALRLSPDREDYLEELSTFLRALEVNTSTVTLHNANGLFVSKTLQLNRDYEMMAKNLFFSDVNEMNFNDPQTAANDINSWVDRKTKGLIPSIIDTVDINPLTELLVTNALYFKSTWLHEFEPRLTHGDCFYKDGVCTTVAMMDLEAELNYAFIDDLRAHALELPYQGGLYSMILLVPQDRDSGMALIRDLPYVGIPEISRQMIPTDVILTMPKFTVKYSHDMVAALRDMRITSLFSPTANLSGILKGSTSAYLNSIYHTVFMSVDEKGTVAAAASAGMVVPLMADQVQLRIDRPFLFFIRDNKKGMMLFEGKIEEPTPFATVNAKKDKIPSKPQTEPKTRFGQPRPSTPTHPSHTTSSHPTHITASLPSPIKPEQIQPIVSQPIASQPLTSLPTTTEPISSSNQPITESPSTKAPSRKSDGNWFKKVTGYFG